MRDGLPCRRQECFGLEQSSKPDVMLGVHFHGYHAQLGEAHRQVADELVDTRTTGYLVSFPTIRYRAYEVISGGKSRLGPTHLD